MRLHAERLVCTSSSVSFPRVHPAELPNGAMVTFSTAESDRSVWLVQDGKLWCWSFAGYSMAIPVAVMKDAELITAPAMVATLAAGYRPRIHTSARDGLNIEKLPYTSHAGLQAGPIGVLIIALGATLPKMGCQAFLAENLLCALQPLPLLSFRQWMIKKGVSNRPYFGL